MSLGFSIAAVRWQLLLGGSLKHRQLDTEMSYTYDIRPARTPDNGWDLHLFEHGAPAGNVSFPAKEDENPDSDAIKVAFQRAEAEAKLWMRGRKVYSLRHKRLSVHPVPLFLFGLVVVIAAYNILKFVF